MAKAGVKAKSISKKPPQTINSVPEGATVPDAGSVDKIRDILFGNQMRDFERRFSLVEERMTQTTQNLRDETHKRLEALEQFFKEELEALKERLKDESDQRMSGDKQQNEGLKSLSESLGKTIAEIEDKFSAHTTELRQQILNQSKSLATDIQTKYEQASQELRLTANSLDDTKIDRSRLAEYFIEMATHLTNNSTEPAAG